jgi:hypothetical protein
VQVKQKHASLGANQQISAAEVLALGTRMASELAANVSSMNEGERQAALRSATIVAGEVATLADQSEGIKKLVYAGETAIDEHSVRLTSTCSLATHFLIQI